MRTRDHADHDEEEDDENADDVGLGEELHELAADVAAGLLVPPELAVLHAVAPEVGADAGGVLAVVLSLVDSNGEGIYYHHIHGKATLSKSVARDRPCLPRCGTEWCPRPCP